MAECKRLFGSAWKTKLVSGTVLALHTDIVNGRRRKSVEAKWTISNRIKVVTLKIVNIKAGLPVPDPSAETTVQAQTFEEPEPPEDLPSAQTETVTAHDAIAQDAFATAHERTWTTQNCLTPLNGNIPPKICKVIGYSNQHLTYGRAPRDLSPFECFMSMFPLSHLHVITNLTNIRLENLRLQPVTPGEILKFFGMLVLMTRFSFSNRRDLWKESGSKYIPGPCFGKIMSRRRFEAILMNICFSDTSERDDEPLTDSRWSLVSGFLKAINEHRQHYVRPSDHICVDESISRWYGLGGDWIKIGLPHYVAYDRKPENGCELKSAACGKSGIMLRMELVMGHTSGMRRDFTEEFSHTTALTLRLVQPWLKTNRVVCGDSYFASVQTAEAMTKYGMGFIGVVKNAVTEFPMQFLASKELTTRGDYISMVSTNEYSGKSLMAVLWMDRERRYFVSSCHTTNEGTPICRERWRTVNGQNTKVQFEISVPDVVEKYYETCSQIDRHNRCRQDSLGMEKKLEVKDWSVRVNTTLLSVVVVDAWLLYKYAFGPRLCMSQSTFYETLAEELIENKYDVVSCRSAYAPESDQESDTEMVAGIGTHLAVTNKKRKLSDGSVTNAALQGRCRVCKVSKSKFLCSTCRDNGVGDIYICHVSTKRCCFSTHLREKHHLETV